MANIADLCNLTLAIALTRQVYSMAISNGQEELTVEKLGNAVLRQNNISPEKIDSYDRKLFNYRVYRVLHKMSKHKMVRLVPQKTQLKTVYYTIELNA